MQDLTALSRYLCKFSLPYIFLQAIKHKKVKKIKKGLSDPGFGSEISLLSGKGYSDVIGKLIFDCHYEIDILNDMKGISRNKDNLIQRISPVPA